MLDSDEDPRYNTYAKQINVMFFFFSFLLLLMILYKESFIIICLIQLNVSLKRQTLLHCNYIYIYIFLNIITL